MTEDARDIINSPFGLSLANFIGKHTPYSLGCRIAILVADFISARKSWKLVSAARSNQWVANGESLDRNELDRIVQKNFRNIAVSVFDYYHNLSNPSASLRKIVPHPFAVQLVRRPEFSASGLVVAGIHMSNFDMAFQLGGLAGIKALLITLSELNEAYQKQLDIRSKSGLNITTASIGSMKRAVNHLRKGGIVMTGIDRPDQKSPYRPKFFGHPAAMPIHHIFLALKAHVPVVVAAILKDTDDMYHFRFSDPIDMIPDPDKHAEIIINAENVLHIVEDFIRQDTSQWSMTFPIWPDIMAEVKVTGR